MKRLALFIAVIMVLAFIGSHFHAPSTKKKFGDQIFEVQSKPSSSTLFYTGVVEPLKTILVTSPTEGVIDSMYFHFGDNVKAGQLLFSLSSDKFQTDYKTALMAYIKAKTEFANSQSQLRESDFLHKNQLISEDDYKAKKINFYNNQLALIQAKDTLGSLLKQVELHGINPYDLKIEEIDKITKMFHEKSTTHKIQVFAPVSGVVLMPTKGDSGELKKINKSDQVKQGDVLGVIGDVNGLTIRITVNEFNINQLKIGQKVSVTGTAFPNMILSGQIKAFDRQGQPSSAGLPNFPVEIQVPALTKEQQAIIHMGMSAKVAIQTGSGSEIMIPIQGVIQKNEKAYVKLIDAKGKIKEVAVETGQTTFDSVEIKSQLNPGDKIVVPHKVT